MQKIRFRRGILYAAVFAGLSGCATQNQTTGTAVGAVVGGIVGKAVGGDRGAILGAAVGAAVGNQVGKHLDAKDRQSLAEARQKALEQQTRQTFYAPSANSNVVVTPSASYYQPSTKQLALASDVRRLDIVESSGEPSIALLDIPVYQSADFSSPPKLTVPRGARISRIAVVKADTNWVLVGDREFAIGYVPAIYFDPAIAPKLASATNSERAGAARPSTNAPRPTNAPPNNSSNAGSTKTDALLSANGNYVPPAAHMRQGAISQDDFRRVLDNGNRNAQTKSGGVSFIAPAVECKELTAVLLTNEKETGREVSKACRKPGAGWSV